MGSTSTEDEAERPPPLLTEYDMPKVLTAKPTISSSEPSRVNARQRAAKAGLRLESLSVETPDTPPAHLVVNLDVLRASQDSDIFRQGSQEFETLRTSSGHSEFLRVSSGNQSSNSENQSGGPDHSTDKQQQVVGKTGGNTLLFRGVDEELNAKLLKRLRSQLSTGQDKLDFTGLFRKIGASTSTFRTAAMAFSALGKAITREAVHAGALQGIYTFSYVEIDAIGLQHRPRFISQEATKPQHLNAFLPSSPFLLRIKSHSTQPMHPG